LWTTSEDILSKIEIYRTAYYTTEPLVSDEVYDALVFNLKALDPDNPFFLTKGKGVSPFQWTTKPHITPMHFANKISTWEDFKTWTIQSKLGSDRLVWREHVEGVHIALQYEEGKLVAALLRGRYGKGDDILANAVLMKGVPHSIDRPTPTSRPVSGVFRGVVTVDKESFRRYFSQYATETLTVRSLAVKRDREEARKVSLFEVKTHDCFLSDYMFDNEIEKFEFFRDRGFKTPLYGGPFKPEEYWEFFQHYVAELKDHTPYSVEGLIARHFTDKSFNKAGTSFYKPNGEILIKFPPKREVTFLKDVVWNIGVTGRLDPVGILEPVRVDGVLTSRINLYTQDFIDKNALTKGCKILIERGSNVTSMLHSKLDDLGGEAFVPPEICPECLSSDIKKKRSRYYCTNHHCPVKIKGDIKIWVHALTKTTLNDAALDVLVKEMGVQDVADLYKVSEDQWANLNYSERDRPTVGRKTYRRIHAITKIPLDSFLLGLNIQGIGVRNVKKIANSFESLGDLKKAMPKDFEDIEGIGKTRSFYIYDDLIRKSDVIDKLLRFLSLKPKAGPLFGQSFFLEGFFTTPKTRLERTIREAGGVIRSRLTDDTTYVVTNDPFDPSPVIKKATEMSITKISENTLLSLLVE
jgi:DNA ligase (NAD+)